MYNNVRNEGIIYELEGDYNYVKEVRQQWQDTHHQAGNQYWLQDRINCEYESQSPIRKPA